VIDPVRPAATRRELVRADVDARQQRADIPRERPDPGPTRGGTSFGRTRSRSGGTRASEPVVTMSSLARPR
jgi:hypothetical protein